MFINQLKVSLLSRDPWYSPNNTFEHHPLTTLSPHPHRQSYYTLPSYPSPCLLHPITKPSPPLSRTHHLLSHRVTYLYTAVLINKCFQIA